MKEERKRILQMVEDKKITVEEALVLLEAIEAKESAPKTELSTNVVFQETKKEESTSAKHQSAKDKILDFVDSAFKKIKDLDLDFNFGYSMQVSHIFQHGDAYVKEMDIDVANGSVKVIPWDQQDVRVECQTKVYRVETQDEARVAFLKDARFSIEGGKMRFGVQQKTMKVDAVVYIPKTQYDKIRIRMFNGPISCGDLTVQEFRTKTANGKIALDTIYAQKAEIETANGHIHINGGALNELEAETINGGVKLYTQFHKADIQTFNGNITANVTSDCETFHAKATTGSVELFIPEFASVYGELKSNMGNFSVDLPTIEIIEEKSELAQKMIRFQSVQGLEKKMHIFIDTKTGSVKVKKSVN